MQTTTLQNTENIRFSSQNNLLVIEPNSKQNTCSDLKNWLEVNKSLVDEKLIQHGGILFRGFAIESAQDFEQIAFALDKDLKNDYLGTSPRNARSEYVFSASELPSYYPIPQHCEMSFIANPPRKIFFYCQIAPQKGGETPVVDFRKVYEQLNPQIRAEFEKKGIKIIRNYNGAETKSGFDFWKLKRWDEMFMTRDKTKAEEICARNQFKVTWLENDRLRLISEQAAMRIHPQTTENVWFNHSQVFHLDAAAIEYYKIAKRQKTLRAYFFATLTATMSFLKKNLQKPENQAMHCTFLDDSPIPRKYMQHVEDVIWANMTFCKWQKGDVIALDNFSTAHGRMPYTGEREVLVAWTS